MENRKEIVNRLQIVVKEMFKTQKKFCEAAGISDQQLSYSFNNSSIGLDLINKFVEVVPNLNLNWVLNGYGEKYINSKSFIANEEEIAYKTIKREMINLLKDENAHLKGQISFLQDQIIKLQDQLSEQTKKGNK